MITALIDGDWVLYAAGFAGQRTEMVCPEAFGSIPFNNITEIRESWKTQDVPEEFRKVYKRYVLDEPSHFFHSAKKMIEGNCKAIADKFGEEVRPLVLLDGDGNFRNRIATIRPYKGTRGLHAKPLMYNDIRQYLLDSWDAEIVYDQETDDELAIRQTAATEQGDRTVIVAVDKDMLQVAGWHRNPNKGFMCVTEQEGMVRLYRQCLTGDSVDNIAGCYKVGPKMAEPLIVPGMSELAMWHIIVSAYEESIERYGRDIYGGLVGFKAAEENMRLVYLRRKPHEDWEAPSAN